MSNRGGVFCIVIVEVLIYEKEPCHLKCHLSRPLCAKQEGPNQC